MLHRERLIVALLALWCAGGLHAQDARLGITVPVTVTGEALYTQRERIYENPNARQLNAAFRAVLRPSLRLGSHWYFYSAIQADSKPFFYYDTYYDERELEARLLQAFLGYTWSGERRAIGVKVGKLSSAFGAFPLRYDDAVNPLLDQPAAYGMNLQLRAD